MPSKYWMCVRLNVLNTKLILIEGIPGSGKSTTAQFITRIMRQKGYRHKWWYEEENGHPVYIYEDCKSMQNVIEELSNGDPRKVISRALEKWQEFTASVQSSSEIIIMDSCLFGYLTWSLFPQNVMKQEIIQYVRDVAEIIKPLNPHLIYFYQTSISAALEKICSRRGGETEVDFIQAATQSKYGITHGLHGFEGLVVYWRCYREITDVIFMELNLSKMAIENSKEEWPIYDRRKWWHENSAVVRNYLQKNNYNAD